MIRFKDKHDAFRPRKNKKTQYITTFTVNVQTSESIHPT